MLLYRFMAQIIPLPDENLVLCCQKILLHCQEISTHCKKLAFIEMVGIFTEISCYSG